MIPQYTLMELVLYLLLYSFVGWAVGVGCIALKDGRFVNRGVLNLPLSISEGITAVILLLVLPTLEQHPVWQFFMTWIVVYITDMLTEQFVRNISRRRAIAEVKPHSVSPAITLVLRTAETLAYLVLYLLLHPFIRAFVVWLPDLLVTVLAITGMVLVTVDYLGVSYALRTGRVHKTSTRRIEKTQRLADQLVDRIWDRLERAYPGVERTEPENKSGHIFAKGICFDKLVWVFLISSFLGAVVEMVYCRAVGGTWMNRSSVLYGPFSFVWGLGAVLLTVVLQRMAGKADRYVFLAGFVIGGAYEYFCSVFTELVYGTVFWDYSYMPLNIGGRTNVLFCVFWGILAVVWLKVLYPPIDGGIEKLPPLLGKIMTWLIVFVMLCNGFLTFLAMQRYTLRQTQPEPENMIEAFLDDRYDDDWMESHWPNMIVTSMD